MAFTLDLLAWCMGARSHRIYLFYQFSFGQTLDRASELSPKSDSVWEITLPITRRKLLQTPTDKISTVGCIGLVRVRAFVAVF
ncbi:MAG: hypothetical protein ACRC62_22035 [Microcoleus sp.]